MKTAERTVSFPNVAVVYEAMTGLLRRKIVPGFNETARFTVEAGEGLVLLHGPPFDDATCLTAVKEVVGTISR